MERITIFIRTTKKEGSIKLRFRLIDGRAVQLYHKSEITADLKDLEKFTMEGTLKPRVTIFNKQLKKDITREMDAMGRAYQTLCDKMDRTHISCELFEEEIKKILNPEVKAQSKDEKESLLHRFRRFIDDSYSHNDIGANRKRTYDVVCLSLSRFLTIKHLKRISPDEFTPELIEAFYAFHKDEYTYVERYPKLYEGLTSKQIPKDKRKSNTLALRMKMLKAMYNEMIDNEEIEVSPFMKLGKKRKSRILTERYQSPRFLRKEEIQVILNTEVPDELDEVKDAFLLQCNFGIRISDFAVLGMDKIQVSEDGIPYIHYLPKKTIRKNALKAEIETPIMKFALDIIKKWQFNFKITKYSGGETGYNYMIKRLFEYCGIDRTIPIFDEDINDNVQVPLTEIGSNKMARSSLTDMMHKVPLDIYAAGLHSRGSQAVYHYTELELRDRFALMCIAFDQPLYKVDKDLNIIDSSSLVELKVEEN